MKRILLVHPRPTRGGFSAVVSETRELLELGCFDVAVAVAPGERLAELDGRVTVYPLRLPLTRLSGLIGLARVIRRHRPDFLHLHGRQAGALGRLVTLSRRGPAIIYTPHGTPWNGSSWRSGLLTDVTERVLLTRTTWVLCVSRAEQAEWTRRDTSPKIRYLPNVVDVDQSYGAPSGPPAPAKSPDVLVPSGYNPQKRIEVVLEAVAMLPEPRPWVQITGTVDDVGYRRWLEELARDLGVAGNVHFDANRADVGQLMRDAGLVVLPSYSEGFPIVGQEAIVAGANVAWSAIPPHFELFGASGIPFWEAEELATVLAGSLDGASVAPRRSWLASHQREARRDREEFWRALGGECASRG